jgi:hypothetical protein
VALQWPPTSSQRLKLESSSQVYGYRAPLQVHPGLAASSRLQGNALYVKEKTGLLVRDAADSLLVIRSLQPTDIILLLTPLVRQFSNDPVASDPFECFGRALESRHSHIQRFNWPMHISRWLQLEMRFELLSFSPMTLWGCGSIMAIF